jgi:hypothetical protein
LKLISPQVSSACFSGVQNCAAWRRISGPSFLMSRPSLRALTMHSSATRLATAPAWMPAGWPIVPPPNCRITSSPKRSISWCIWPAWMPPLATGMTFFRSAQSWSKNRPRGRSCFV